MTQFEKEKLAKFLKIFFCCLAILAFIVFLITLIIFLLNETNKNEADAMIIATIILFGFLVSLYIGYRFFKLLLS